MFTCTIFEFESKFRCKLNESDIDGWRWLIIFAFSHVLITSSPHHLITSSHHHVEIESKVKAHPRYLRGSRYDISWYLRGTSQIAPGWKVYNSNIVPNLCLHLLRRNDHRKVEKNENRNISALSQLFIASMVIYISDSIHHFEFW
jgi:hypothetical protein